MGSCFFLYFFFAFLHSFYSFPCLTLSFSFCPAIFFHRSFLYLFITSCCKVHDFCENELQDNDKCGSNLEYMMRNFKYNADTYRCCKFININFVQNIVNWNCRKYFLSLTFRWSKQQYNYINNAAYEIRSKHIECERWQWYPPTWIHCRNRIINDYPTKSHGKSLKRWSNCLKSDNIPEE